MEVYPSGLAIFVIWLIAAGKSLDRAFAVTIAFLPLGMLAVMRLPIGGMTPSIAHVAAAGTVTLGFLSLLRRSLQDRAEAGALLISPPGLAALSFAAYGLAATFFLPRLFRGATTVFSFERQARGTGTRISHEFRAEVVPLGPTPANISQVAYVVLGVLFFLVSDAIVRRRGVMYALKALRWAAVVNLVLGTFDLLGLDIILAPFRTAQYSLLNEHVIAGLPRVIGGFPEASSFGSFSAALSAFFLVYGLSSGSRKDTIIGALSLILAALALSSTAIFGILILTIVLVASIFKLFIIKASRGKVLMGAAVASFAIGIVILALMIWSTPERAIAIISGLTINKGQSSSGLERGAMALSGLMTFVATWGFGAGIGSIRSNGFGSAMLGSLGVPGVLLFGWFVWSAFLSRQSPVSPSARSVLRAAQVAGLVHLAMMGVSSFSLDPGLMFMLFAAIAFYSRYEVPDRARFDVQAIEMARA